MKVRVFYSTSKVVEIDDSFSVLACTDRVYNERIKDGTIPNGMEYDLVDAVNEELYKIDPDNEDIFGIEDYATEITIFES